MDLGEKMAMLRALNELKQKISACLFWHDYKDGKGEMPSARALMPIFVCDPETLKALLCLKAKEAK
jgi:hypothetical protein